MPQGASLAMSQGVRLSLLAMALCRLARYQQQTDGMTLPHLPCERRHPVVQWLLFVSCLHLA